MDKKPMAYDRRTHPTLQTASTEAQQVAGIHDASRPLSKRVALPPLRFREERTWLEECLPVPKRCRTLRHRPGERTAYAPFPLPWSWADGMDADAVAMASYRVYPANWPMDAKRRRGRRKARSGPMVLAFDETEEEEECRLLDEQVVDVMVEELVYEATLDAMLGGRTQSSPHATQDAPPPPNSAATPLKKQKKRARVWKEKGLAVIVHGADEHTTWTRQVSSFLRTVRPVLGDRSRACRWGGSIVDSVVGTFLTQNVSDALSSSAFMTLAAHFRRHADRDATPPRQEEDIRQGESTGGDELMSNAEEGLTAAQATSVDDMRILHPTQNCTPHNVALAGSEREACSELGQQRDAPAPLPDRGELPIGEDCCDWEAVMNAPPAEIANCIKARGMQFMLAARIQQFLRKVKADFGSLSLEHMRDAPADDSRAYLHSINGLGSKSVACIMLLALGKPEFPVDTNVGRIMARLGWVPLESETALEDLEDYANANETYDYLRERLSSFGTSALYELHYQMITLGKVFCSKRGPNCTACPVREICEYSLSDGRKYEPETAWPKPSSASRANQAAAASGAALSSAASLQAGVRAEVLSTEEPTSGSTVSATSAQAEAPSMQEPASSLKAASAPRSLALIPYMPPHVPKGYTRLEAVQLPVDFEFPAYLPLSSASGDVPLLALVRSDSTAELEPEIEPQVKLTFLVPCRAALRGAFPLNGTYFQVNELFVDTHSEQKPVVVPARTITQLPLRQVFFGHSVISICRGMTGGEVTAFFVDGFMCIRSWSALTGAPQVLPPWIYQTAGALKLATPALKDGASPVTMKADNNQFSRWITDGPKAAPKPPKSSKLPKLSGPLVPALPGAKKRRFVFTWVEGMPETVDILANGCSGTLKLKLVPLEIKCAASAACMSPSAFEAFAGLASRRNWRGSIHVKQSGTFPQTIGRYLRYLEQVHAGKQPPAVLHRSEESPIVMASAAAARPPPPTPAAAASPPHSLSTPPAPTTPGRLLDFGHSRETVAATTARQEPVAYKQETDDASNPLHPPFSSCAPARAGSIMDLTSAAGAAAVEPSSVSGAEESLQPMAGSNIDLSSAAGAIAPVELSPALPPAAGNPAWAPSTPAKEQRKRSAWSVSMFVWHTGMPTTVSVLANRHRGQLLLDCTPMQVRCNVTGKCMLPKVFKEAAGIDRKKHWPHTIFVEGTLGLSIAAWLRRLQQRTPPQPPVGGDGRVPPAGLVMAESLSNRCLAQDVTPENATQTIAEAAAASVAEEPADTAPAATATPVAPLVLAAPPPPKRIKTGFVWSPGMPTSVDIEANSHFGQLLLDKHPLRVRCNMSGQVMEPAAFKRDAGVEPRRHWPSSLFEVSTGQAIGSWLAQLTQQRTTAAREQH